MAGGDLIASAFSDVQSVLQLALLVCHQDAERAVAAMVGAIVAIVGSDNQRWPTQPLFARRKKLPPATALAIRRDRRKSRLAIKPAAQRWIAPAAEYFDRRDTLS